jgi:hypothetical protein
MGANLAYFQTVGKKWHKEEKVKGRVSMRMKLKVKLVFGWGDKGACDTAPHELPECPHPTNVLRLLAFFTARSQGCA